MRAVIARAVRADRDVHDALAAAVADAKRARPVSALLDDLAPLLLPT